VTGEKKYPFFVSLRVLRGFVVKKRKGKGDRVNQSRHRPILSRQQVNQEKSLRFHTFKIFSCQEMM
jgi:hypothetical protein